MKFNNGIETVLVVPALILGASRAVFYPSLMLSLQHIERYKFSNMRPVYAILASSDLGTVLFALLFGDSSTYLGFDSIFIILAASSVMANIAFYFGRDGS